MAKDFSKWHREKSGLHELKRRPFFYEKEVWFASLGANIGFEEDGKGDAYLRPVIILKKFNNEVCWGIPTTRKDRKGKYYFRFAYREHIETTAILSQLRLIDSKRLGYRIGAVSGEDFIEMKNASFHF